MNHLVILLFAFHISVAPLLAREGGQDGNWWRTRSEDYKLGFLTGYVTAANTISQGIDPAAKQYPGIRFGNYTLGQLDGALEDFYRDPFNRNIQVTLAITWVKNKIEGQSEEELQRALEWLRKSSVTHRR